MAAVGAVDVGPYMGRSIVAAGVEVTVGCTVGASVAG